MHHKLIAVLYVLILAAEVHSLRGALFRSGRSFRFRQPRVVEDDAPVEVKRNVLMYPMPSMEPEEERPSWAVLSSRMRSRQ
ncbi:hypothetical protein Q1695_000906 [Nippostrongylus brasiliensis]|nr:hypothetical protein Q1695_000906 [Nippostrongylus brasiliensis]